MYYQNYEDYMRANYGIPNPYYNNTTPTYYENYDTIQNRDIEHLYPELYHSVYPIICKVCDRNTKPINEELLEELTAEVFIQLESDGNDTTGANVKIQVRNNSGLSNQRTKEEIATPRQRNPILQDLVKILILRELLGRPGFRPNPPRPPRPPRPPYPGPRPPFPIRPRTDYVDEYYY